MKKSEYEKIMTEAEEKERLAEIERNRPVLEEVIIGENVKSLKEVPEEVYDKAKKIIVADNIKEIPDEFFMHHNYMEEVCLPLGLEKIGDRAFRGCEKLKSIRIPDTVTSIGKWVFSVCEQLEEIIISNSLREAGDYAFYWNKVKKIKLPKTVEKLGARCIASDIEEIELDENNENFKLVGNTIFSRDGKSIVMVFNKIKKKRIYEIPEGVEHIEEDAFAFCRFSKIILPKSMKKIGKRAFYEALADEIVLPEELEEIGEYAFSRSELLRIKIPESIKEIKKGTFDTAEIREVILPDSIEILGDRAFKSISQTEEIKLPKNLKRIGATCFEHIYLKKLVIPDSVEFIGSYAISSLDLEYTNIPKSLREVGNEAYGWKRKYKADEFPKNLEVIKSDALEAFYFGEPVAFGKMLRKIGIKLPRDIYDLTLYDNLLKVTGRAWDENEKKEIELEFGNNIFKFRNHRDDGHGVIINVKSAKTDELRYSIYLPEKLDISDTWGENFEPDFDAYDRAFEKLTEEDEKLIMAFSRLDCPYKLSDEARKRYEDCLKNVTMSMSGTVKFIKNLIAARGIQIVDRLSKYNIITKKVLDKLIERAEIMDEKEEAEYFKAYKLS